jgi:uncharacterized alpha-E superfamily protein
MLFSQRGFRPTAAGDLDQPVAKRLLHAAIDVVRTTDGSWRVVQDQTDAPAGLGYAMLNRSALARVLPEALRLSGATPIQRHADTLRVALTAMAPSARSSPRCVVLTSGPAHPTYVEHSYLATQLGYHLAEGADLVMRQGRLWLRALDGLEPLDVVYRRIGDAGLDPLEPQHVGGANGVPGLVWGAQRGGVVLANAYGAGVLESTAIFDVLHDAAELLLGEQLRLDPLRAGEVPATAPVFEGAATGRLTPAGVVLRFHAVAGPDGIAVMPGGVGRVLAAGDDPRHPTAQRVKDVWVVDGAPAGIRRAVRIAPPPQVDFGTSVTKRVADALFHLGRAAERAEVAARTARVVGSQLDQDPMLASVGEGGWGLGVTSLLRAAQATPLAGVDERLPIRNRIDTELRATAVVAADQLAAVVQEASSVREFLSATMGRVLGRMVQVRADMVGARPAADDLDLVLVDLAALTGLVAESTVRGPGWRFLDLGRRLERALAVVGAVESALGLATEPMAFQPLAEATLAANESLVAYRRRYRSDVDLDAVLDLLVRDDSNPRSLAFQLDRLREHVAALAWSDGVGLVQRASLASLGSIDLTQVSGRRLSVDALVVAVRGPLLELGSAVAARWFADPVNPVVLRGQ